MKCLLVQNNIIYECMTNYCGTDKGLRYIFLEKLIKMTSTEIISSAFWTSIQSLTTKTSVEVTYDKMSY